MNYNATAGGKPAAFGRKIKRVSDVTAMGYNPYEQGNTIVNSSSQPAYANPQLDVNSFPQDFNNLNYGNQGFNNSQNVTQNLNYGFNRQPSYPSNIPSPNLSVLGQPMVQDMALQYGQQIAGAGKTMLKKEVERYIPVSKLKYYFAVDTNYVLKKLVLLFFPFTHKDWSVKYEQDGPVQPRFEINAPDLYIPTMAYITYVLVAGLVLGTQQRFSPEQIGILASSALAWCIVELAIYSCTLYLIQVETSLRTLDLLAYAGYKFVGTIFGVLVSLVAGRTGYYSCLIYSNLALAFFLVRSLKVQVLAERNVQETSYYGVQQPTIGHKRRLYFLLFMAGVQPVLSWWLSFHLLQ